MSIAFHQPGAEFARPYPASTRHVPRRERGGREDATLQPQLNGEPFPTHFTLTALLLAKSRRRRVENDCGLALP